MLPIILKKPTFITLLYSNHLINKILYPTVYSACLLASHGIPFGFETGSNPLFFTNVCDLSALHEEHKYIACKFYFVINNALN